MPGDIYTDWANHYLERAKHKRLITDLQVDVCDGVLLADVIQAVTNEKVQDIKSKPKTTSQMVDNISTCLACLASLGVNIDGLNAKDIRDGNLKSILGLFFSLSRYKQQQKQSQTNHRRSGASTPSTPSGVGPLNNNHGEMLSRLPSALKSSSGSSKCPTVTNPSAGSSHPKDTNSNLNAGANLNSHLVPPGSTSRLQKPQSGVSGDRSLTRGQASSGSSRLQRHQGSSSGTNLTSFTRGQKTIGSSSANKTSGRSDASSRSTSPSSGLSGIPKPGSRGRSSIPSVERPSSSRPSTASSSPSAAAAGSRIQSPRPASATPSAAGGKNNSMLDKFKLFKEKGDKPSGKTGTATRTGASHKSSAAGSKSDTDVRRHRVDDGAGSSSQLPLPDGGVTPGGDVTSPKPGMKAFAKKTIGRLGKKGEGDDDGSRIKRRSPPPAPDTHSRPVSSVTSASSTTSLASSTTSHKSSPTLGRKTLSSSKGDSSKSGSKIASLSSKGSSSKLTKGLSAPSSGIPSSAGTGIPKPGSKSALKEPKVKAPTKDSNRSTTSIPTARSGGGGSTTSLTKGISKSHGSTTTLPSGGNKLSPDKPSIGGTVGRPKKLSHAAPAVHVNAPDSSSPQHADTAKSRTASSHHPAQSKSASSNQSSNPGSSIPTVSKLPTKSLTKQRRVDGDTQTTMSMMKPKGTVHAQPQHAVTVKNATVRENSSHSLKSDSTTFSAGAESNHSSSHSTNSKESNSSNDSVIFRPSSGDELESESDNISESRKVRVPTDHISNLKMRQNNLTANGTPSSPKSGSKPTHKVETTFDTEVRTEMHDLSSHSPKETTFVVEDAEEPINIKPMQPISRLAPYSYLRGLSTPSTKPSLHMPTFSIHTNMANSASNRLGVNRSLLDPSKLYSNSLKRTSSHSSGGGILDNSDCASEGDICDVSAGYMSDGDILRNSRMEDLSGYISEGGASIYARRMQQRFREGMQAVKECMQKSTALCDTDSFDDSSSISSGEISDTIAEISTDENLTGSSLSASSSDHVNPYGSLKRGTTGRDHGGQTNMFTKQGSLLKQKGGGGTSMGRSYGIGSSGGYHPRYISSDSKSDIGGYTTELDRWHKQRGDMKSGYAVYAAGISGTGSLPRRLNGHATAVSDSEVGKALAKVVDHVDSGSKGSSNKRDSETNTELSSLMLQKMQGSGQGQPPPGGSSGGYHFRRPSSGVSVASTGSNISMGSAKGSLGNKISKAASESGKGNETNGIARSASKTSSGAQAGRPLSGIPTTSGSGQWSKATSGSALIANGMRSCMSETESMESLVSASASIQAQIQHARALSMASRHLLQQERDSGRIERSGSMRSSQSEKLCSPTNSAPPGTMPMPRTSSYSQLNGGQSSPTPSQSSGYTYPLSGLSPTSMGGTLVPGGMRASNPIPYGGSFLPLSKLTSKEDDLHGSSLSLVSSSSSVHSTAEERQAQEIRKLRRELEAAKEKVTTLTTRLSTNAHVVAAFEQSLTNMTTRLQQLTTTAEQKDSELLGLRRTIEALRSTSGLAFGGLDVMDQGHISRRPSSTSSTLSKESAAVSEPMPRITRHRSSESMNSLTSMSSACSGMSQQSASTDIEAAKKKKKKNWFRSSFGKAFSRKKGGRQGGEPDLDSVSLHSNCSVPNSPLLNTHQMSLPSPLKTSGSSSALSEPREDVVELQHQLHEKDMKLTDIRLEALSSAAQLEQLKEAMNRMKSEMTCLKADNQRLQRMVVETNGDPVPTPQTLLGCKSTESLEKRLSLGDPTSPIDMLLSSENAEREGRKITVTVNVTPCHDPTKMAESKPVEFLIGTLSVSGKTKWDMLDGIVRRIFKEYVLRVDPVTNLGLNAESICSYQIGEITRTKGTHVPELLPCGYLVGESTNIALNLKGTYQNSVDCLACETLIPKSIVQRYISLLLEHRRIILCGPSGTGKTYLAQKLAEYLVLKSGKDLTPGSIATFNVDHKSGKELRQYLANIAEQCESSSAGELPSVIILDNLHHVNSLGEVFNGFLTVKYQKCPYIIGTMNQTTCSTTNLQLHHNFRWVLCANHMEPVKGFLGRYLRRKLVEFELNSGARNNELHKIVEWVPKVWQHLNKFLETHSSSDVTIGPRLFLSCPMDMAGAQVWFTDLWNYSIVPYLLEAVREGLQLYGRRSQWEDPVDWILDTYPLPHTEEYDRSLLRLRPEDVGYDSQGATSGGTPGKSGQAVGGQQSDVDGDPLLNMLMRLQEAASYSSPQSNDSDSTSLDSHSSSISGPADHSTGNTGGSTGTNSAVESTL